jgi:hypothetical protein
MVNRWATACNAALLRGLDESGLVETMASDTDLADNGAEKIKICVIQFSAGGRERIGFPRKPLTDAQASTAFRIHAEIIARGTGDLFAAAEAAALANAAKAWYGAEFEASVLLANHVIEHANQYSGEAYRIRGFSRIMQGRLNEARDDLEKALSVSPSLAGVTEPLEALVRTLSAA